MRNRRRFYEDKPDSNMVFSKETIEKKGPKFVKVKANGDEVVQSSDGPVANVARAVLNKADTDEGDLRTLRDYKGDNKKYKKGAGINFGEPGYYGIDSDFNGEVDDVYVVTKDDIEHAKNEGRRRRLARRIREKRNMREQRITINGHAAEDGVIRQGTIRRYLDSEGFEKIAEGHYVRENLERGGGAEIVIDTDELTYIMRTRDNMNYITNAWKGVGIQEFWKDFDEMIQC